MIHSISSSLSPYFIISTMKLRGSDWKTYFLSESQLGSWMLGRAKGCPEGLKDLDF